MNNGINLFYSELIVIFVTILSLLTLYFSIKAKSFNKKVFSVTIFLITLLSFLIFMNHYILYPPKYYAFPNELNGNIELTKNYLDRNLKFGLIFDKHLGKTIKFPKITTSKNEIICDNLNKIENSKNKLKLSFNNCNLKKDEYYIIRAEISDWLYWGNKNLSNYPIFKFKIN